MPNATMWYVMSRVEREIIYFKKNRRKKKEKINAISYVRYCTVVVELGRQQLLLLVAVELVD
jgi:hypothetical protein